MVAVTLYYDNAAAISTASDGVSLADSKKVKLEEAMIYSFTTMAQTHI